MSDTTPDRPRRRAQSTDNERPQHPTGPAIWLLVGVTLLIVALAALSSYGRL
jgi:hypothetical protein